MVGTRNSWPDFEQFAPPLHSRNSMNASVRIKQHDRLYINPENGIFPTYVGMPGFAFQPPPSFRMEQQNIVQGMRQCLSRHFQNSPETPMPSQKEMESVHYAGPNGMPVSNLNNGSYPKGFLIFDQSGDQKRLMYAPPMCPPVYFPLTVAENKHGGWLEQERAAGELHSIKDFFNTLSNENYVAAGESEMHENTEEIDALLYSDSDDDVTGSSDDEVTSTGHSPEMINEHYEKEDQCQETTTEVASSYDPRKRQRLNNGESIIKPQPIATTVSYARFKSHKSANDAESSCGIVHEENAGKDTGFCNSFYKKDRIKETLRVLESLVPGAKGNDPWTVIDKVIDYLKSLKHEASAQGASYP